jgi:CDP-glucose 4,6-dehydratase
MVTQQPSAGFWYGKRILLTGHTGFKGGWLALWLHRMGAQVTGLSLAPNTQPNLFSAARIADAVSSYQCDIRDAEAVTRIFRNVQPEIVFHLAAQPLVRLSYRDPLATFSTNIMGTSHVLNALRNLTTIRVAIMVTTDKVYRNTGLAKAFREDDSLGGHDPYSASKAASELVIDSYRKSYLAAEGVAIASARAGNVIGGGDWSVDRLIPDAVRAWQAHDTLRIRRPDAVRPWQHVLEPLAGYMCLAMTLWDNAALADAYNFGPHTNEAASVRRVIELARNQKPSSKVVYAEAEDTLHEAQCLSLETTRAQSVLGVQGRWSLEQAVSHTMTWYEGFYAGAPANVLCENDIDAYEASVSMVRPNCSIST